MDDNDPGDDSDSGAHGGGPFGPVSDEEGPCPWVDECDDPLQDPPPIRSTAELIPNYDGIELGDGWEDECDRQLIGVVWAFLQTNLDLIEWSLCVSNAANPGRGGGDRDCVIERILGQRSHEVLLLLVPSPPCRGAMWTRYRNSLFNREQTWICSEHPKWANARAVWCDPCADQAAKDCAVINIAGSLLHEVTHYCGFDHGEGGIWPCDVPYMVGNAFVWACFQRYPAAASSPCCEIARSNVGPGQEGRLHETNANCVLPCSPLPDVEPIPRPFPTPRPTPSPWPLPIRNLAEVDWSVHMPNVDSSTSGDRFLVKEVASAWKELAASGLLMSGSWQ